MEKFEGVITVDDPEVGMPRPTEIAFNLAATEAQFIGNQLVICVSEATLRALATMRKIDFAGTDSREFGPLQGYMDEVSICFIAD